MASPGSDKLPAEDYFILLGAALHHIAYISEPTKVQVDEMLQSIAAPKPIFLLDDHIGHAQAKHPKSLLNKEVFTKGIKPQFTYPRSAIARSRNSLEHRSPPVQLPKPPRGCEFALACLAKPGRVDEVLGDAEEDYRELAKRFPLWVARWCFRLRVARTVIGMLPGLILRVLILRKLGL